MRGYTTDYVNLIADNLRDRYQNGFPILKELIQNADDAKARRFIFGKHSGFPNTDHPLLRGPGLWVFNDGKFTESDAESLRSFGISGRAGDSHTIGKFGLGMKSVFHLCEALFYVAKGKNKFYREGLTPWIVDGHTLHQEWEEISQSDWKCLKVLGEKMAANSVEKLTWFLLWLPLRKKKHLRTSENKKMGCIISRFPGDDPNHDLAFLYDKNLAYDMAETLPLLRHLESIEHNGKKNAFVLKLRDEQRLLTSASESKISGEVQLSGEHQPLDFSGLRDMSEDGCFKDMRKLETWPSTRYRDKLRHVCYASDKSKPEAAVLFYSRPSKEISSKEIFFRVHWAVFLPVEDHAEEHKRDHEERTYSLVLHGQFFLDAGRKKIHDFKHLHDKPKTIDKNTINESLLRRTWNQRLAQNVLSPLVLPALQSHVKKQKLSDSECALLTADIWKSDFFTKFQRYICGNSTWLRTLQRGTDDQWRLIEGDCCSRLRPLPTPKSDRKRPWQVFPKLSAFDVIAYDVESKCLRSQMQSPGAWRKEELDSLLNQVNGLFESAPSMGYLIKFLDSCVRKKHRNSNRFQRRLLNMMRIGLLNSEPANRRKVATNGSNLIGFLNSNIRLKIATDLPESILKKLWQIEAPLLLVPNGLDSETKSKSVPDKNSLVKWLNILNDAFYLPENNGDRERIVGAIQGLLRALPEAARRQFLQQHRTLRIIKVGDAWNGEDDLRSVEDLNQNRKAGTLFHFTVGSRRARMGITPRLARVIPEASVYLIRIENCRDLFGDKHDISGVNNETACLRAVGKYSGQLGGVVERRALLKRANNPGTDDMALRGLRFLLHGSFDNREDDETLLWVQRYGQHSAWRRLWAETHSNREWSLIHNDLVDVVPRVHWEQAKIAEIDDQTLIEMLDRKEVKIENPKAFSAEDRNEILSKIQNEVLWRRLPLHLTVDERLTSVTESVYLDNQETDFVVPPNCEVTLIALNENEDLADKQRRWLPLLDRIAGIEIWLNTPNPKVYWCEIMDAVNGLQDNIPVDLEDQLRETVWLPTADGTPVKPRNVIEFRECLKDEARLIVTNHRNPNRTRYAVHDELSAEVQDHNAWNLIRDVGFSAEDEGLDLLARLLEDLPDYRIGDWQEPPADYVMRLLAHNKDLPGWRLLERVANSFDLETAWAKLSGALSQEIQVEVLTTVLNWLAKSRDEWDVRKSAHDSYLRQLASQLQTRNQNGVAFLSELKLAAANNSWQNAKNLCAGAHSVVAEKLLDQHQLHILGNLICNAIAGEYDNVRRQNNGEFDENHVGDVLCNYFKTWDANLVPRPMIGLVLALLGKDFRPIANHYLSPHSFKWIVRQLPWRAPSSRPYKFDSDFKEWRVIDNWMGGKNIYEALDCIVANVGVHHLEDTIQVLNLQGDCIEVSLDPNIDNLLIGGIERRNEYNVRISFRSIDVRKYNPAQLREMLRATAEILYHRIYNQNNVNFDNLWRELDQSHQLEIEVARRLILNHIPFYLRQLTVRCETIEQHLEIFDRLRYRIAEAEIDNDNLADGYRQRWQNALVNLACCIEKKPNVQNAVVQAVKDKLKQYQYDLSSIPLELFQNSDDAAVELGQFHAPLLEGRQVPSEAQCFVVEEREDGLRFIHWGRPVNARGPVGFDGENRGYHRDLEKMLILSSTDKLNDDVVTGKFGLGFKSVLLASEQPRILSGHLAIRIVAGILPQIWDDPDEAQQRLRFHSRQNCRLPGTLIDLPNVNKEHRDYLLQRFRQLAGILCVFGRAIRTIKHVNSETQTDFRWQWQPREICHGVEIGELDLNGKGVRTKALCIRTDNGSVLMAIGPQGFRSLPDDVPALWVTAPTRESSDVGFAVNSDFDLDAGRGRLAGNPENNLQKAKEIGSKAGAALSVLFKHSKHSRENWVSVQSDLSLTKNLGMLDFWESIWLGITKNYLKRGRSNGENLTSEVAFAALAQLCSIDCPRVIPNGLKGPLRAFSDMNEIRYEFSEILQGKEIGKNLCNWERFKIKYRGEMCVSREIADILRNIDSLKRQLQPVDLSVLVDLLENSRVDPEDAELLGRLHLLIEDRSDWNSNYLRNRLTELLFQSEGGRWIQSRDLLVRSGTGRDSDETLRHSLAPPEHRLHSAYYVESVDEPAVTFFRFCRQRMQAPPNRIADWVLAANSDEERRTALIYLADGELGERVADHVREREWLLDTPEFHNLKEALTVEQQYKLSRRLMTERQIDDVVPNYPPIIVQPRPPVDLREALTRLYEWSEYKGCEQIKKFRNDIYPNEIPNLAPEPEPHQPSWFLLLALGSFQSIGRTIEQQHSGFVHFCINEGWWKVFTECDPRKQPERWMSVIEGHASAQEDDEQWIQWLMQFPKLYRLRRWLRDYIELFLSINQFMDSFSPDTILAPRVNPYFQGGGIDAPPLTRTLRVGFPFVVRELLHSGVIHNSHAVPHAYAPIERIRRFFRRFNEEIESSEEIHKILTKHLGKEKAKFNEDYDIPLRIISAPSNAPQLEEILQ